MFLSHNILLIKNYKIKKSLNMKWDFKKIIISNKFNSLFGSVETERKDWKGRGSMLLLISFIVWYDPSGEGVKKYT